MISKESITRLLFILAFAMLFVYAGDKLPDLYHEIQPSENYFEVIKFEPEDVYENETLQNVKYIRNVKYTMKGSWFDELILMKDNSSLKLYDFKGTSIYEVRPINQDFNVIFTLPENLEIGEYYWQSTVILQVNKDVTKTVHFKSEKFKVLPKEVKE